MPEEIRWIPATTEGNVERIVIDPGAEVTAESVIVELSNPELEQRAQEAERNLRAAETRYENRRVELESVEAALTLARVEADAELAKDGPVSALQLERRQATELEQVPLDEGQRVTAGANLARVGDPTVLKAELRIAETQAKDVQIEVLEGLEPDDQVVLSDMSALGRVRPCPPRLRERKD